MGGGGGAGEVGLRLRAGARVLAVGGGRGGLGCMLGGGGAGITSSRACRPGKSIWKLSGSRRSTAGSTASGRLVAAMTTTGVAASEGESNPSQSDRNCALST